jgi:hypothetical protein
LALHWDNSPFRVRAKALENLVSFECLWLSVPQNALQRIPPYVEKETPWPFSWANFRKRYIRESPSTK